MSFVRGVHKLSDVLDKIMENVIFVMILMMVVITGAEIVCRIFFTALTWSEEATRYLLIWSSMLGAGCVYKHGGHIAVTALQDHMPPKVKKGMKIAVQILCLLLFILITYYGIQYYHKQGSQTSAAMKIPMKYVYMGITIGAAVMGVHALDALLQLFTGNDTWAPEQPEMEEDSGETSDEKNAGNADVAGGVEKSAADADENTVENRVSDGREDQN